MGMKGSFEEHCNFFLLDDLMNMIETAGSSILKTQGLYSLEKYLPTGSNLIQKCVAETERENHFFQWVLCKQRIE